MAYHQNYFLYGIKVNENTSFDWLKALVKRIMPLKYLVGKLVQKLIVLTKKRGKLKCQSRAIGFPRRPLIPAFTMQTLLNPSASVRANGAGCVGGRGRGRQGAKWITLKTMICSQVYRFYYRFITLPKWLYLALYLSVRGSWKRSELLMHLCVYVCGVEREKAHARGAGDAKEKALSWNFVDKLSVGEDAIYCSLRPRLQGDNARRAPRAQKPTPNAHRRIPFFAPW